MARMSAEVFTSDQEALQALGRWCRMVEGARVEVRSTSPAAGRLGFWDHLLLIGGGSGGLVAVLRVLPEFIRSRRSGLTLTVKIDGKEWELRATNVDTVLPIIEKFMDE
jgi:Effector Associated Constant Component 1